MVMARVPAAAVAVWGLAQALAQGVSSAWAPFLAQAWATEVARCPVQARGRASTDCPVVQWIRALVRAQATRAISELSKANLVRSRIRLLVTKIFSASNENHCYEQSLAAWLSAPGPVVRDVVIDQRRSLAKLQCASAPPCTGRFALRRLVMQE